MQWGWGEGQLSCPPPRPPFEQVSALWVESVTALTAESGGGGMVVWPIPAPLRPRHCSRRSRSCRGGRARLRKGL